MPHKEPRLYSYFSSNLPSTLGVWVEKSTKMGLKNCSLCPVWERLSYRTNEESIMHAVWLRRATLTLQILADKAALKRTGVSPTRTPETGDAVIIFPAVIY